MLLKHCDVGSPRVHSTGMLDWFARSKESLQNHSKLAEANCRCLMALGTSLFLMHVVCADWTCC